jgi:hypothetical protein
LQGQDGADGFEKPIRTADETDDGDDATPAATKAKSGRKGPATPKATDDQGSTRPATIINLDEKVAWRSAPARTRIDIHPRATNARLVRLPAYPKSDWMPVEDESKIAKN